MALSSYVGSFNIDTAVTAGNTQSVTGVGFVPKIVIFWWSGTTQTSDGARGEEVCFGTGAVTGASARFATTYNSDDGAATSASSCSQYSNSCIVNHVNGVIGVRGAADWGSFDADGFTLTIDNQFEEAIRVSYLALGGTDVDVFIGNRTLPTATGNFSTTGVGFVPKALITTTVGYGTDNSGNTNGAFTLGWATGDAAGEQGLVNIGSQSGQATSNTNRYAYNDECSCSGGSSPASRLTFVSFDEDGFTLNRIVNTNAYYIYYICLGGDAQFQVGELNTATDGSNITETVGFQSNALMFLSNCYAINSVNTKGDNACLSLGAGTSTTNRAAQGMWDEDNLADTETCTANYDSAVYANVKDDAIVGLMDLTAISSTGFTCVMDDTDPSAYWVTYLAIGAAGGAPTVVKLQHLTLLGVG